MSDSTDTDRSTDSSIDTNSDRTTRSSPDSATESAVEGASNDSDGGHVSRRTALAGVAALTTPSLTLNPPGELSPGNGSGQGNPRSDAAAGEAPSGSGRTAPAVRLAGTAATVNGLDLHLEGLDLVERVGVTTTPATDGATPDDAGVDAWIPSRSDRFLVVGIRAEYRWPGDGIDRPSKATLLPSADTWTVEVQPTDSTVGWASRQPFQTTDAVPAGEGWYVLPSGVSHPVYGHDGASLGAVQVFVFDLALDSIDAVRLTQGDPVRNLSWSFAVDGGASGRGSGGSDR